ncbi:MAG: chitobiase/beta-hexosaminidase C-terminal domain-containing protein, partial [Gorillibacterium sp.]|nr:chitobiase/beta-hexosaminidase C-terminal domain-containing protein [Gorillibacterium sp.]
IYGIQWLPTAPYMNYLGLRPDAAARTYNAFKADKGGAETGWYHIIWPFEALSNPQNALSKWDPVKIANDDNNGKKEWANTYWFLHAMDAFGSRSTDIWSSNWSTYQVFIKNGIYTANIWNPTDETKYVVFRNAGGNIVGTITVTPKKTVAANPVNGIQPPNANDQAAAPTFSPVGGTYASAQSVGIASTTAGATIRYTTDGSEPTTASAKYVSPIMVAQNTTIKAKASKDLMKDSTISSAIYVINVVNQVVQPVITPVTGTYTEAQNVTITSSTIGATIRYTTDGSTPTSTSGTVYSGPFNVPVTATVKAIAYKSGMTDSPVASAIITISASSANLALGKTASAFTYQGGNTAAAAFDGSVSTRWESEASDPQWIQVDLGSSYSITGVKLNWETAAGKDYKIQVSTDNATWSDAYTKTGGLGGIENNTFNTPVPGQYVRLSGTARTTGYGYSLWEFEVYGSPVTNQVATPVFSPIGGAFTSVQTVTLTSATPGAIIKYTTDGTIPASNSATYSSPLTVSSTSVVKAIAVKSGMTDSAVATSTYTINLSSGSAVPGKIEAESYTAMNGIQTEECSEGTQNISYTDGGDWMDYTVTVEAAGTYTVEFRLASPYNNTQLQLMKGTTVLATVTTPNTGSFQTWQTVSATVTLSAGTQTLRVYGVTNGWNFNYMNFR